MAAYLEDTIGELRELLADIREAGERQTYGFCASRDPRDFSPDSEVCTPEELALHKADCERVAKGEPLRGGPGCDRVRNPDAGSYGMGVTTIGDPAAVDWAERLERYIAQLEGLAVEP